MTRTVARWRVAGVHCADESEPFDRPIAAPAAPSPSIDSGNCSDASSSEPTVGSGVWSPLAAYVLPPPCGATRGPSHELSQGFVKTPAITPVQRVQQTEDHFVRRMDTELARIREAPVKIQNDTSKYIVTLDVNIFRAEDIQLMAEPNRLTIIAEREAYVDASRSVVRRFVRRVVLPDTVATDALATRFDARGILTITMLKRK